MLKLPEELRSVCAKPHGKLYEDIALVKELKRYKILACIGDFVTYHALKSGFKPHILVIDYRTAREELKEDFVDEIDVLSAEYEEAHVKNPPGFLTADIVRALLKAVKLAKEGIRTKLIVDGEEDLAVMPLVCLLPYNSLIIYGQPREGMVVLRVDEEKKILILKLLEKMEKVSKDGEEVLRICRESLQGGK